MSINATNTSGCIAHIVILVTVLLIRGLQEEKETVVRDIILWDLNHLISRMHTENKIDSITCIAALLEILTRMRELARARGYLRYPWEKQQGEEENDNDSL